MFSSYKHAVLVGNVMGEGCMHFYLCPSFLPHVSCSISVFSQSLIFYLQELLQSPDKPMHVKLLFL